MAVHHIHPHVMHHKDSDNNSNNDAFGGQDIFQNLDKVLHKQMNQPNSPNTHTFSATYTNNNGHVHKNFSQNGHKISENMAKRAMNNMRKMDHMFDGFGNNDLSDHKHHGHFNNLFGLLNGKHKH